MAVRVLDKYATETKETSLLMMIRTKEISEIYLN